MSSGRGLRNASPPSIHQMTIVTKNEIYNTENLAKRFSVHKLLGPPPPPSVLISGGARVYPKNCNHYIQLYPKLHKRVSHVYPNLFFICSPTCSVPQSFVPLQHFPRHDEATDGPGLIPLFHGVHASHGSRVRILCVSQQQKGCVPR